MLKLIKNKIILVSIGGIALVSSPVIPVDMEYVNSVSFKYETPKEITLKSTATSTSKTTIVEKDYPFPDSDGDGMGYSSTFKNSKGEMVIVETTKERYENMGKKGGYEYNPTKVEYFNVLKYITPLVSADIAHDAVSKTDNSGDGWSSTTVTWAHTITGDDTILFVHIRSDVNDTLTGITYNGSAMTEVAKVQKTGDRWNYLYYIVAPTTGANNIVATSNTNVAYVTGASSYTGASQTGVPDASTTQNSTGTSVTTTLTTVADNSWIILTAHGNNMTAGTGSTFRVAQNAAVGVFDTNGGITPAGSTGMTITASPSVLIATIMASFAPVQAVTRRIINIE